MKEVLEDTRLVTLQREGGAILARMRKEEFRFAQSEDYRYTLKAVENPVSSHLTSARSATLQSQKAINNYSMAVLKLHV